MVKRKRAKTATRRMNPIVAYGIRVRKRNGQRKREEAKRLERLRRMEIKARRREQRNIAKEVAIIRKKTRIEYD